MLTHKATIDRREEKTDLVLSTAEKSHRICLTDDNPSAVKEVFNELVVELKAGKFIFELHDEERDLYYYICDDYIQKLNDEIADVYSQLKKRKLTAAPDTMEAPPT